MRHQRIITWTALVAALALTAPAVGDDRDFLREVAAAPNLIFILDTSGSMGGSPENADLLLPLAECDPSELVIDTDDPPDGVPDEPDPYGCSNGLRVPFAMVPGAADDPYSRLGIAKRVLRDFLEDVGEANIALAGYAQAQPADPLYPAVPQKHWVYEARAQDRFRMIEGSYAYRFGYSETHTGLQLDVPADILKQKMIGYKLYFDPDTTELVDRFGPVNAYETDFLDTLSGGTPWPVPYDLMPIYFGNCFVDDMGTPSDTSDDPPPLCMDNIFPFYDSGVRDGMTGLKIPTEWYYGQAEGEDYPGCDPNDPIWDDGTGSPVPGACENEWEETSGANVVQYQRRVRLEIPTTYGGNPNHFLASDGAGGYVGNTQVADAGGNEDYDLDGFADPDYDGDESYDWVLYVNSVEERNERTCAPAASLPTWTPTLTPTPTFTETPTPTNTPTPIVDCAKITITEFARSGSYDWRANISNQLSSELVVSNTEFTWIPYNGSHYVDFFSLNFNSTSTSYLYYPGNSYTSPTTYATNLLNATEESAADIPANDTSNYWYVNMSSYVQQPGFHQVCFDFIVYNLPSAGANWECNDICAEDWGSANTPTPTLTPTSSPTATAFVWPTATPGGPTATRTPTTPSGGTTNTPTRTPTSFVLPTNTPTPFPTSTPTRTGTPTRTPTPPF